jgi:signal transduction histidine kinase
MTSLLRIIAKALQQWQPVNQKQEAEVEVRQILARVERAKQEWENTIDSLSHLVCLLDHQARIIRANRTLERWNLGLVTEVRGHKFPDLLQVGSYWTEAWASVEQGQAIEFEIEENSLKRHLLIQVRPSSRQTYRRERLLESFAVVVVEDVTRRKQAEDNLRHHAQELQERNEELDAFAHTVAHDLQNPLGLIVGFAGALNKHHDVLTAEETTIYLQKIIETGRKMSNIIYELLLLASVRQQEVELDPLDMAGLVAEVRHRLTQLIEEYQAEIIVPGEWPLVLGYSPWIEEVWVNYISNGIKYGGRPPRLVLGADLEGERMVRFWIHDNGPGLTAEQQGQLFRPFIRFHRQTAEGHGLGLSIVHRIITKLGGQVAVASEGVPGQGAIFSFTLPRPPYLLETENNTQQPA